MTLPIFDTPLAQRLQMPGQRPDGWNPALEPALYPAAGREELLARLRMPGALAVTTGQQPGLLTGPAYTLFKALSARGLAAELERRWGRPVLPIYWVPGDDHDFDEVATVKWIGWDGSLQSAALPPRAADAPLVPMHRQPLGPGVEEVLRAFQATFPEGPPASDTVEWLRRHYRPEHTVAGAFGAAMAELLTPLGVLCLDGSHHAVKVAAAPHILQALQQADAIEAALAGRNAVLQSEGRAASVPVGDGASLVFLDGPGGRDRLVMSKGSFVTRRGRTTYSLEDLRRIGDAEPERLSANVLLRPAIESAVLPTVAYCAGPGELKYLALAEPVYQRLGIHRQLPTPRWSGLLVEPRVTRILDKFRTSVDELRSEGRALEIRLAREALPAGTESTLASLKSAIDSAYADVIRAAAAVDPNLERPAGAARGQALRAVDQLENKLLRHALRRESIELDQVTRARQSLRPDGTPQERVVSMSGFLARYGMGLLGAVASHIEGWYSQALEAVPPTT